MNREEFNQIVYDHQSANRGIVEKDSLLKHFNKASTLYYSQLIPYIMSKKNGRFLDIACGYGNFLFFLSKNSITKSLGIDSDIKQVELAKSLNLNAKNVNWNEFNSTDKFDCISALDFLEHIPIENTLDFFKRSRLLLEEEGLVILRIPNSAGFFSANDYFNDLTHEWSFTPSSIEALLNICNFEVVNVLNDSPQFNGFLGGIQNIIKKISFLATKAWLATLGLSMPRVYTRSMWVIAKVKAL